MTLPFEIEVVGPDGAFVLARQLEGNAFRIVSGARLGDVEVSGFSQPLLKDDAGEPRLDVFLFRAKDRAAARTLRPGQRVELRAEPALLPELN